MKISKSGRTDCVAKHISMIAQHRERVGAVIALLVLGLGLSPAMATNFVWKTAGVSTTWEDSSNWTPAGVPVSNDTVMLSGGPFSYMPSISDARSILGFTNIASYATEVAINGSGTLTIGASGIKLDVSRAGLTLNPNIVLATQQTWSVGSSQAHEIIMTNGTLTGTGPLTLYYAGSYYRSALIYGSASGGNVNGATFTGGLVVSGSYARVEHYLGSSLAASGSYAFGGTVGSPGDITLNNGGTFRVRAGGTSSSVVLDCVNPIKVGMGGGTLLAMEETSTTAPIIRFTGPILLGGPLYLQRNRMAPMAVSTGYVGTITLQQASAATALISTEINGYENRLYTLPGNIVDGSGTFANPLILRNNQDTLTIAGSGNTYSKGTVVDQTGSERVEYQTDTRAAQIVVAAGSRLGTGDVMVLPGGKIRITDSSGVAGSASVRILSSSCNAGVFGVGYNGKPTITSDSSGVLALDAAYSSVIDLATLGNGQMFLGTTAGSTYSSASLGVGAGNTYRLGGGTFNQTLTLSAANVITGTAALKVGSTKWHGTGLVKFSLAQDYSGATEVNGHFTSHYNDGIASWGSELHGVAQTIGSPFGGSSGAVTLRNSYLKLFGAASGLPVSKGQLSFQGRSSVSIDDMTKQTDLTFASSNRVNRGTLIVSGAKNHLGGLERIFITTAPGVSNGIVAPYMISTDLGANASGNNFASYAPGTGFGVFSGYVAMPAVGTGAEVVRTAGEAVADMRTIYALKNTGAITGAGKLVITGGGLIMSANIAPAIDFGSAEGVIWYDVENIGPSGIVSGSNGLTVSALVAYRRAFLNLLNTANDFTGQITVAGGALSAAFDTSGAKGSLGDLNNDILLDGGILLQASGDRLQATRTITLGESGGLLYSGGAAMTIYGPITGPGCLVIGDYSSVTIASAAVNDYQGGTRLICDGIAVGAPAALTVTATASLGSGDVQLETLTTATFQGNSNVASSATVHAPIYSTVNFQSAAPSIGGLLGSGSINLGTASVSTTLTVGGGDVTSWFYGTISQISGSFPGSLTKTGSGTFSLYGPQTFTGPTTVNAGKLALMGSVAGNVVVNNGTLTASGQVAGNLTLNGSGAILAVDLSASTNVIVVGGTADISGATLALTGPGLATGTALTIISANSIVGTPTAPEGYNARVVGSQLQLSRKMTGLIFSVH